MVTAGLVAIALLAYTIQTTTGFGAMILTITIGAWFADLSLIKAVILPISLGQCIYLAIKHYRHAHFALIFRQIVPIMGSGIILGAIIDKHLEGVWLLRIFAAMITVLSAWQLYLLLRGDVVKTLRSDIAKVSYGVAGIMHGIYVTGGPLLVYALGAQRMNKQAFRSTILWAWVMLNSGLVTWLALDGQVNVESLKVSMWVLPASISGLFVGEILHHRIPERRFRIAVFALLAFGAFALFIRTF